MATNKRVFTLRLEDDLFDKIGILATGEHRSINNTIRFILKTYIRDYEKTNGEMVIPLQDN